MTKALEMRIEFPDEGVITNETVSPLGDNCYRLETSPMANSASIYDVIEAESLRDETLRFQRVVAKSGWRTYQFAVSRSVVESNSLKIILSEVEQVEGRWELVLGGILLIHLPPNSAYDPTMDIEALAASG